VANRQAFPAVQTDTAKTSGSVSVLVASTVVAADNPQRVEITVVNDSVNVVYLQLATVTGTAPTAVANSGIRLNANGGSWTSHSYSGPVAGIAVGGSSNVTVAEV
jgi:hypothetical protein